MAHEFNHKDVCIKCGCSRGAVEAFNFRCKPDAAVTDSAPLEWINQSSARMLMRPKVFISHSHHDRGEALRLQALLDENNAITFLDQEEILPGDNLPVKIRRGIGSCDKLVLIWSEHAAASKWVRMEWEAALALKKRIIPYLINSIDDVPLPDALEDLLFVEQSDQEHGHGELFRAIFGTLPPQPKGVDLFPGHWEAEVAASDGSGNALLYELELRPNGQVTGSYRAKAAGTLGLGIQLAQQQLGIDARAMLAMFGPFPVRGNWSYRPGTGLRLDLTEYAYGQESSGSVQIHTVGTRQDVLHGVGPAFSRWTFRRKKP